MSSTSWLNQDAGSIMSFRFSSGRNLTGTTLFENNSYLRILNQTMLMELGAVELYQACETFMEGSSLEEIACLHNKNARSLQSLIVSNRGIPDKEKFSFPSEISLFAHRIGRHLPELMAKRTSYTSCLRLEKSLRRRYHSALLEAPLRDRGLLQDHLRSIKTQIECLISLAP